MTQGGQGGHHVEEITLQPGVQNETGIGQIGDFFLGVEQGFFANPLRGTGANVEIHFVVHQRIHGPGAHFHLVERFRLDQSQRPSTREMDEEDVILNQVMKKRRSW